MSQHSDTPLRECYVQTGERSGTPMMEVRLGCGCTVLYTGQFYVVDDIVRCPNRACAEDTTTIVNAAYGHAE